MKIKSFKYRIIPTQEQQVLIAKHFWVSRFVWNYYLKQRQDYYLNNKEDIEAKRIKGWLNYYDNAKDLTQLKKQDWFDWIWEVNSQTLQATLKHLEWAYRMFFRKSHQFPKYKSKKRDRSFTIPQYITINNWKLFIPNGFSCKTTKNHLSLHHPKGNFGHNLAERNVGDTGAFFKRQKRSFFNF